ncbi:hypothetical protein [Bacillus cereus group sp. MYBK220-1]|uniref:hypothetical protein n=1 Tax=Bacillus cereus group sp. MYBK220-1 TaxID=3450660 RepID=UPI003F79A491
MEKEKAQLDNYLNDFLTCKHLNGYEMKNTFDKLEETAKKYKKAVHLSRNLFYSKTKGQNYTRVFPIDNENYYSISWDINKAKTLIKDKEIRFQKMKIEILWKNVSTEYIDYKYVNNELSFQYYEPIIVVFYAPLNEYIVIDGNHRLAKQRMKKPEGNINVYLLEPDDHIKVMCGELFRTCYKIMHNVTVISNYLLGNINSYFYSNEYKTESGAKFLYKISSFKLTLKKLIKYHY